MADTQPFEPATRERTDPNPLPVYEPPRIETVLDEDSLARESQYAGQVISGT